MEARATVQGRRLRLRLHPTEVFVPNLMSWLSAAHMRVRRGDAFLDVGTGSGLHAILAVLLGARRSYGTDINPVALALARANARLNGVSRVCRFLQGSLVEPLASRGLRVDAIVYNAPHFPGRLVAAGTPDRLARSVDGGAAGGDLNARFLREAPKVLAEGGRIYNPVVAWSDPETGARAAAEVGYRRAVLARANIPVWGRGNHTRDWLMERPGRHSFAFAFRPRPDGAARIEELTLAARRGPRPPRLDSRVVVDFRADR